MTSASEQSELHEPLLSSSENAQDDTENKGDRIQDLQSYKKNSSAPEKSSHQEKEDKVEDAPPPVSFLKLFHYMTAGERLLLALSGLAALMSSFTKPLGDYVFGDLTGAMVDFGAAAANATAEGRSVAEKEVNTLREGVANYALYNAVINVVDVLLSIGSELTISFVSHRQTHRLRDLYLRSLLKQEIGWHDVKKTGGLASSMSTTLDKLEVGDTLVYFATQIVSYVAGVVLALVRGWELALVCLVSVPFCVASLKVIDGYYNNLWEDSMAAQQSTNAVAEEALGSIRTVIAFGGQEKELKRYAGALGDSEKWSRKRNLISALNIAVYNFTTFGGYALAFWYGVRLILRDKEYPESERRYDAATVITVFYTVMTGWGVLSWSSYLVERVSEARAAAAKVFAIIDRKPLIDIFSEEGEKPFYARGDISFKNVHFEYPSRKGVTVLKALNLQVKAGETVALVGSSGCGKSTCIQLIQRFYDPAEGAVELDGRDLRTLNVGWLRSQIGVVEQEPVLFHTSVAENIRYGREDCTMDDVVEAAKIANAHDFISKLPQGYETEVGERGAQISVGQKQRIVIARTLVRRPKILLLDEATSALDTSNEAKVKDALEKASVGRTTVVVAHRLSTVRSAHRIVVLSGGAVVEQGSHDQLMALGGHYHHLVTAQLSAHDQSVGGEGEVESAPEKCDDLEYATDKTPDTNTTEEQQPSTEDGEAPPVGFLPVLRLSAPEWYLLVAGSAASLVVAFVSPLFNIFFGEIIGVLSQPSLDDIQRQTHWYCGVFLGIAVIMAFATFLEMYVSGLAEDRLTTRLKRLVFSALLRQEVAWYDNKNNSSGALCSRLTSEVGNIERVTGQRLISTAQSAVTLLLCVWSCLYYDWRLGLVTIVCMLIVVASRRFDGTSFMDDYQKVHEALEKSTEVAVEVLGNIRTVVSLNQERLFHAKCMEKLQFALDMEWRTIQMRKIVYRFTGRISKFAYIACMYYGGTLVYSNGIRYEDVFKVSEALTLGTGAISSIWYHTTNFQRGLTAASKIFQLLNRKSNTPDPETISEDEWTVTGDVRYSDVQFSYPTRPHVQVLQGLSLHVASGKSAALVGSSGCGKSTCLLLLQRFYDPASGAVALDGRDISKVKLSALRSHLGMVQQEPVLFDRTIAENIAYGDNSREVALSEITDVAKTANIDEFIQSLPLGYNTRLGHKGTQLSGGQKQRVAIARALVRNPRVLLLDEATSALDTESEKVVQQALNRAKEGRTCITIAHRLSTIQDADVIYVINDGKVAEMGTHVDLIAKRGLYYKLQSQQSS